MKRYLKWFAAGLAFAVGGALAANLSFLTPQTAGNDFLPAINQLIQQLNGGPGYTGVPQIVSLGPICTTNSGGTVCNGQRGVLNLGTLSTAASGTTAFTITDSLLTGNPSCAANISFYGGTWGTNGFPVIASMLPSANQFVLTVGNAHTTNALNGSAFATFICM